MSESTKQPVTYEDFAAASYTKAQTALAKGVTPGTVTAYAARHNLIFATNKKKFEKVDPDRLAELAEGGFSQASAAAILGVSHERIRQIADRDGIEFITGKVDHDLREKIEELHALGMTDAEIARDIGRAAKTIRYNRNALGLPGNKVRPSSKYEDRLRELAASGMSKAEAARDLGIAPSAVFKIAEKLGIAFIDGRTKRFAK